MIKTMITNPSMRKPMMKFNLLSTLSDSKYHNLADDYLENLTEYLEDIGDKMDAKSYDVLFNVNLAN